MRVHASARAQTDRKLILAKPLCQVSVGWEPYTIHSAKQPTAKWNAAQSPYASAFFPRSLLLFSLFFFPLILCFFFISVHPLTAQPAATPLRFNFPALSQLIYLSLHFCVIMSYECGCKWYRDGTIWDEMLRLIDPGLNQSLHFISPPNSSCALPQYSGPLSSPLLSSSLL